MTQSKLIVQIPFQGFYESIFSQEIDNIETMEAEWKAEDSGLLDASDYCDIFFDVTNYRDAYLYIAKEYVKYFNDYVQNELRIELNLEFESMKSPREYNFTTDRIFAYVPTQVMRDMLSNIDHKKFENCIEERHNSRSGFASFYSNNIEDWKNKPIEEYDHNELCTLLTAYLTLYDDYDNIIFERMADAGVFQTAFDNAVDWTKFDERVAELIAEKKDK